MEKHHRTLRSFGAHAPKRPKQVPKSQHRNTQKDGALRVRRSPSFWCTIWVLLFRGPPDTVVPSKNQPKKKTLCTKLLEGSHSTSTHYERRLTGSDCRYPQQKKTSRPMSRVWPRLCVSCSARGGSSVPTAASHASTSASASAAALGAFLVEGGVRLGSKTGNSRNCLVYSRHVRTSWRFW